MTAKEGMAMIKFGKVFTWGEINKMYPDAWVKVKNDNLPYGHQSKIYVYGVITDEKEVEKARLDSIKKQDGYYYCRTDGPLTRQADLEWQFMKHNMPCYMTTKPVPTGDGSVAFECELHFYDPEEDRKFHEEEAARRAKEESARQEQNKDK